MKRFFRETLPGRVLTNLRVVLGSIPLLIIIGLCVGTLHRTNRENLGEDADGYPVPNPYYFDGQDLPQARHAPSTSRPLLYFGTDGIGRSILSRCLFGGSISLAVGFSAAAISVTLGVSVGLLAGYAGGWIDAGLMRVVDVLYGLPYVLMIILIKVALDGPLSRFLGSGPAARLVVLFLAIGLVSWLTMARVVRGQVLSLRGQPFIEAARAVGLPSWRIFLFHLLPNLIGPIIVYATLIVPQAILQESFLSFLGIGIDAPMSTWGSLAADGLTTAFLPPETLWWRLLFPCLLLAVTLLSLNFVGDGLRDALDPKRDTAKI